MKSTFLISIAAVSLLATMAMPVRLAAQEQAASTQAKPEPVRYTVTDLGTLGGTSSMAFFITNNHLISGTASRADGTEHAVLSYKGLNIDIGKDEFGGANSIAFGVNESVQAAGEAETFLSDPNLEDYCGFKALGLPFSGTCLPFLWKYGVLNPLPTLGGNNGAANMINHRGEVAGSAENATPDRTCPAPQVLHFKPVIWEDGQIKELDTIHGDPNGVAFGINDNGQVVGASGDCSTFNPNIFANLFPLHALLWQKGTVTDLGNLGGGFGHVAFAVNKHAQVVGVSDLPGDLTFHAFRWTSKTGMRDLGTLDGDVNSVALGISDQGDVAGVSLDKSFTPHPILWRNGARIDLNAHIPASSLLVPLFAESINSAGEVVGTAIQISTGELHAYLGTPSHNNVVSEIAVPAEPGAGTASAKVALPQNVREQLQQRLRVGRFGGGLMWPR